MKIPGIYKIQSKIKPERIYIGSAVRIGYRWNAHLCFLQKNKHINSKLQDHFNKYGESDLVFSVLLGCNKEDLLKTEQYFLDSYNPYFNICKVAGSSLGLKRSDKTRKKQSLAMSGKKQSIECIRKRSESMKGIRLGEKRGKYKIINGRRSEETKMKMRLSHLGKKKGKYNKLKIVLN